MTALPKKLQLPARGWVELRRGESPEAPAPVTLRDTLAALDGPLVRIVEADGERRPVSLAGLALADVNVVRATLTHLGVLPEDATDVVCENCDAPFTVRPSSALELGPYFDGEANDEELDAPFPFDDEHEIPAIVVRGKSATTIRLREVTASEVAPLHRALEAYQLRITTDVVRAMGIAALGEETDAARIARALQRSSGEALDVVLDLFDEAHYPPRLWAEARCPKCGAKNPVEAPALREFPSERGRRAGRDEPIAGFPDQAAFEALVLREAPPIYERLGVRNVELVIWTGTPDCDDGGVPLLGSYTPPQPDGVIATPPEVRIYYRTFRSMFEDEPYDVRGEIVETIEHELEHHLAFLAGDDPEDDRERAEIVREARRATGDTETLRRATKAARGELGDFLYRTWPLWAVVLVVTIAAAYASR